MVIVLLKQQYDDFDVESKLFINLCERTQVVKLCGMWWQVLTYAHSAPTSSYKAVNCSPVFVERTVEKM